MIEKPKLIVLVGPTAVGKTALSIEIAKRYHCEIISGDSMQVYRGMDIGTAKITTNEMSGIPHHLIDIRNPDETYSVADFQLDAKDLIEQIAARDRLPFIVGGTGLYVEALCYDFQFQESPSDETYREQLRMMVDEHGVLRLYEMLKQIDPEAAERLHPNDVKRVIRALEVHHVTGQTMSEQLKRTTRHSPYDLCMIGLMMRRETLYSRIEQRIDSMIEQGWAEEVQRLLESGYDRNLPSMQGLGYKELTGYLAGEMEWFETEQLMKRNTRRFAKRQLSWFRHMQEIKWIDVDECQKNNDLFETISGIIAGKFHADKEYI